MAHVARTPNWFARAKAWIGAGNAIADGATTCGNPTVPANGITVTLLDSSGAVVQTTTTDASGEFTFTNLSPGDYVVQVTLATGTISTPAIVQPGQTTTLVGELDVDCHDINHNGNTTEIALDVHQSTPDGSSMDSQETEDGGQFSGDVQQGNGMMKHESGTKGDRSDEHDVEDNQGSTSPTPGSGSGDHGSTSPTPGSGSRGDSSGGGSNQGEG
jgi:hypothetical protein